MSGKNYLQVESSCIRCGKTRIFYRQWKEQVDGRGAVITHVETVCPDKDCQKLVDADFAARREKKLLLITNKGKLNKTA